jgi:hypothetical protein
VQERSLHQPGSEGPPPQGGHRGGPALAATLQLDQLHLPRSEEEWGYAAYFKPEKVGRGASRHSLLQDGDGGRRGPRPETGGLGGVHRPTRRLFSHSPLPLREEVFEFRVERPPISFLCPSLRLIPSAEGFHSSDQVHQGAFPDQALGAGWPAATPPPPCFFVFLT